MHQVEKTLIPDVDSAVLRLGIGPALESKYCSLPKIEVLLCGPRE